MVRGAAVGSWWEFAESDAPASFEAVGTCAETTPCGEAEPESERRVDNCGVD